MNENTFRAEINRFHARKSEIKTINDDIRKLRDKLHDEAVTDTVKGSQTEFPFVQHSIPISGIDFDEQSNRELDMEIKKTVALLNRRKIELLRQYREIRRFIDSIDDPLMRQIITLRYVQQKEWRDVAKEIGGKNTENSVRMMAKRFFERG